jgi:hypothetical protein
MKEKDIKSIPLSILARWEGRIKEASENEYNFERFCSMMHEAPLPIVELLVNTERILFFEGAIFGNDLLPTDTIDFLAKTILESNPIHDYWTNQNIYLATYEDILIHHNASRETIMRIVEKCDTENLELGYEALKVIVTRNGLLTSEDTLKIVSLDGDSLSYVIFKDALETGNITPYEGYQLCLREDLEWQDERRTILLTHDKWYKSLMESLIAEGTIEESMGSMPYTWFARAFKWNMIDM